MSIMVDSNLFDQLPTDLPDELTETLIDDHNLRIVRIVSTGQASPDGFWYDQAENEWVVVLKGEAELLFEDEEAPLRMMPGDFVHIPAHRKHRVHWTTPAEATIWLAVFYSDVAGESE